MQAKVLITVKTYPSVSSKYEELVCTAGLTEEGKWIRIYPVCFRRLEFCNQYKKYDYILADLTKNTSDFRPESFRPISPMEIRGHIETNKNWDERKKIVLKNIYTDLGKLISDAKDRKKLVSLATFRPTKVIDFVAKPTDRDWDKKKLAMTNQLPLFGKKIKPVRKLPYNFYYIFEDENEKRTKMLIEDWEVGALYWNMRQKCSETESIQHVKNKFFDLLAHHKELYFFLGTTKLHHLTAPTPLLLLEFFILQKKLIRKIKI